MVDSQVQVLVICGASGAGKTATLWEIGHRLQGRGVRHALIDTDELDRVWPQPEPVEALVAVTCRNLESLWATYSELGVKRLVLCGVMVSVPMAESWITRAVPGAALTFVRLVADHSTRERRIRGRGFASGFEHEMRASDRAAALIEDDDADDLARVATDRRSVNQVAAAVLIAADWID